MPQKTIQDLDAYIQATAVVYDHSNTKLVSRKTKVSRRRKEAFLSVLPYRKPSSHYLSHERRTSSSLNTRKPRSKTARQSNTKDVKQKLQVFVRTPSSHQSKTLYFELHPETFVSSLKETIQKRIGVEVRHQRLYIREIFQLCDLLTLEENGVDKNEIISLRLSIEDPKDKANIHDEYLKDLSSKIESSWKELAKHLGFEEVEIADIQTTNEGSTEESRHMLLTWWEKTTDRDEAAQKLRRALEAIGLTDLAQNVPVTSESRDETAGPEPERFQDAGVDEESKENGAASTKEENVENDEVPKDKAAIDDEYLKGLSPKIESSWKELAKHLGFEEAEIADIQTTNKGSTETSHQMLLTWWEKTTDRDEAAQKLRRALEAIGLTDFAQNVPVTSESKDEAAGPEPERRQDAGVDDESKQNGAASTEEEKLKKERVGDQDKPGLIRHLQVFIRSHCSHRPKIMCLQVDPETSVLLLKVIISENIGVHPQQQRMFIRRNFRNFELHNLLTLHDCGIHQDENISLRLCTDGLLGGGPKDKHPDDDQFFRDLASKAGSSWEKLARSLGYGEDEIRQIQTTNQDDKERSLQMLLSWWRKQANRKEGFQSLSDALNSIGCAELALMIPSEEQQRMKQEEVAEGEKRRTSSQGRGPRQEEGTHQDNPQPEVQEGGAEEQIRQNKTRTSSVDQRQGQQGVVHRDKSQPPVQVGGAGTESRSETLPDDQSIWNHSKKIGTHWKELALNLNSRKEDIYIIEANHPKDVVWQCFEMLSAWWRKQENYTEARQTLEKALIDLGRKDSVRGISAELGRAHSSPSDAADQCRSELADRYTTTGSYVQLSPWVEDDMKHVGDIYTKLQLEKGDQDDIEGDVKEYGDIFLVKTRYGKLIKRAILCGSPGMGKSTIIDKMAYDWATGGALGQFSLLFVLKMSALKQTSGLVESVFSQLLPDDTAVDKDGLEAFIKDNGSRVLILIDGFDEFGTTNLEPEKFGSILRMLNRKFGKKCFVVVTTRPSHLAKLKSKSLIEKPFTHVNVLGFRMKDIGQYVRKFFPKKLDEAERLLDRIQSSGVLSGLARSPMILLLMCIIWREEETLPDTLSRLFSEAIRYIFQRKMPELSEEAISEVVIAIGKVALEGLVSPEQRLSFQEGEFEKSALDKAMSAGILTSQRVIKWRGTHNNVQFIHKTIQEYCAAMYCQNLLSKGGGEFQKILDKLGDPMNFEYLLRFCCGDNQHCTRHVLRMLHEKNLQAKDIKRKPAKKLALNCYFESQSRDLLSVDFIESFFTGDIKLSGNDHVNSFVWLLQHVAEQTELSGVDYFDKVSKIHLKECNLSRLSKVVALHLPAMKNLRVGGNLTDISHGRNHLGGSAKEWAVNLRRMKYLAELRLNGCCLDPGDVVDIASSVGEMPNLAYLNLSGNKGLGGNAETWAPSLQSMIHLKKLDMTDCSIKSRDLEYIAESVSRMQNLVDWELLVCNTEFRGLHDYLRVQSLGNGIELSIGRFSLTAKDLADVLQSFINRSKLVRLSLVGIHGLGGSASIWTPLLQNLTELQVLELRDCSLQIADIEHSLQKMWHLKSLDLSECGINEQDMQHITSSIEKMPNVAKLNLSENKGLADNAGTWAANLQRMMHLKKLDLRHCSIKSSDFKYIAESVSRMRNLVDFDLGSFTTHDYLRVHSWSNGIALSINWFELTVKDFMDILQPFSDHRKLVRLTLDGIYCLRGSARIWSPLLQNLTELQKLELSDCSLQSADIGHIAAALGQVPNLTDFNLSKNSGMGNVGTWEASLQRMMHLKSLNLSKCDIKEQDIPHIVSSVGEIPNLADLSLLGNKGLGGNAGTWAASLPRMVHLKSLDLSECGINEQDIPHIASSVGEMPNLTDLDLSGNDGLGGNAGTLPGSFQAMRDWVVTQERGRLVCRK